MTDVTLSRRTLLGGGVATLAALAGANSADAHPAPSSFTFLHITDAHIQPELGAKEGVHKAFAAVRALKEKPTFALIGGDLVMDATAVSHDRAAMVYDLWREAAADLSVPLYYTVGNHDVFATSGENKISSTDPEYGKKFWLKRVGLENRYTTFDSDGWRFIVLDSVQTSDDGKWWGEFDADQLAWIEGILRKTDAAMPLVFLTHIPVMTLFSQYTQGSTAASSETLVVKNGKRLFEMVQGKNVKAVFQGHTHVVENCDYLGCQYITGGAICGDWWKGKRLGVHPEGFGVATVKDNTLSYRYVPYGWTPQK